MVDDCEFDAAPAVEPDAGSDWGEFVSGDECREFHEVLSVDGVTLCETAGSVKTKFDLFSFLLEHARGVGGEGHYLGIGELRVASGDSEGGDGQRLRVVV